MVCGIPTNPKWDGTSKDNFCTAPGVFQCNSFYCKDCRHPNKHACPKYERAIKLLSEGYRICEFKKNSKAIVLGLFFCKGSEILPLTPHHDITWELPDIIVDVTEEYKFEDIRIAGQ